MFARMSSGRRVMTGFDNVAMELFIIRDIEFFLVINESVLFFLVLPKFSSVQFKGSIARTRTRTKSIRLEPELN
jgi:hypothetical protein